MLNVGKAGALVTQQVGSSTKDLRKLKQARKLEKSVTKNYEHLSLPMQESIKLFDKAQEFLKPYKEFMPEARVRDLIHQTGIKTFSRPKGIPESFKIRLSNKGAGMEYVHPTNNHLRIRVMPGKPHSPFPYQQKPYVVQMQHGKALDQFGNKVGKDAPAAHIPLDEFVYKN